MSDATYSPSTYEIIYWYGQKIPRKMKKRIYGTRRSRRRFDLAFIRLLTVRPRPSFNIPTIVE